MISLAKYSFLVISLFWSLFTPETPPHNFSTKLQKAETLYANQKYDSAALIYQQLVDKDKMESFELYYNLGNTYFKLNAIPSAILYYEKAAKLQPQNDDLQYNLALCNRIIPDKLDPLPQVFFVKWYNILYNAMPLDDWAYLSILLFIITVVFLGIFFMSNTLRWRRIAFNISMLFMLLTFSSMFIAHQKYTSFHAHNEAIVFTPSLIVKSQPTDNSVDIFVIHEGTKVYILDKVGEWKKIKIRNGSIGWVLGKKLEHI